MPIHSCGPSVSAQRGKQYTEIGLLRTTTGTTDFASLNLVYASIQLCTLKASGASSSSYIGSSACSHRPSWLFAAHEALRDVFVSPETRDYYVKPR